MREVVEKFWELFDEKRYMETKYLFHDDCVVFMETSRERFDDIDLYLQMNCDYPGKWRTVLKKIIETEDEIVTLVHVFSSDSSSGEKHYVTTTYRFREGLIYEMNEYWGIIEDQPDWRKKYSEKY